MARDADDGEAQRRGVRTMPLLLAGLLTFGAAALPWAVPGGGGPAQADAEIWDFTFALPGDSADTLAAPRRRGIRPAPDKEKPGPARRN
jgi:hypothetical protein